MPTIELTLCNPRDHDQKTTLFFATLETPIATKYYQCLKNWRRDGYVIVDPLNFCNFPNSERDRSTISAELNRCIDLINRYAPATIPDQANPAMTQEGTNHLHHYFEILRGSVAQPAPFFLQSPAHVRQALEDYNLLIHRYESMLRNDERLDRGLPPACTAVLEFEVPPDALLPMKAQRYRRHYALDESDYEHFQSELEFGTWCINYCEVGKPIWDVFIDQDVVIGDDNIRPQRHYSSDAFLQFCVVDEPATRRQKQQQFSDWWDQHDAMLRSLGFTKHSARNSIGYIPAATLIRDRGDIQGMSDLEVVQWIGRHQHFQSVATRDADVAGTSARSLQPGGVSAEAPTGHARRAVEPPKHGTWCWMDLACTDAPAAKRFYGALFGWEFVDVPAAAGMTYSICLLDGYEVASLYSDPSASPHWKCYVAVDDLFALASKIEANGGCVDAAEPRGALVRRDSHETSFTPLLRDPFGGSLLVWTDALRAGPTLREVPGSVAWSQLITNNTEAVGEYYAEMFGWSVEVIESDPRFSLFRRPGRGGPAQGSLVAGPRAPYWCPHVLVADAKATLKKLENLGGQTRGLHKLPGAGQIAGIVDSQGAYFGISRSRARLDLVARPTTGSSAAAATRAV